MSTIKCMVKETSETSPNEPGIIDGDRNLLYSEFEQYVSGTAEKLWEAGCREGMRVAIILPDSWQYAVVMLALFRLKVVACPLNTASSFDDLVEVMRYLDCNIVIGTGQHQASSIEGACMLIDATSVISFFGSTPKFHADEYLSINQPATIMRSRHHDPARKFILHTFGNHYYSARGFNHSLRNSSHCRWLLTSPLSTLSGFSQMIRCLSTGATLVIPEANESLTDSVTNYEVTHMVIQPEQLHEIECNPAVFKRIQAIIIAGIETSADEAAECRKAGLPIRLAYVNEEAGYIVTLDSDTAPTSKLGTAGTAHHYCTVAISEEGEIILKGPILFSGYVQGDHIHNAIATDGWFGTGDLGLMDTEGYLTCLGKERAPCRKGL